MVKEVKAVLDVLSRTSYEEPQVIASAIMASQEMVHQGDPES